MALPSLESAGKEVVSQNQTAKPLIVFFCATYLKPEMQHIYRQISSLDERLFSRLIVTQKIENLDSFPFQPLVKLKRSPWRWLARFKERSCGGGPWQISRKEALKLRGLLKQASIFHIFFGTVGIHLLPILKICPIPVVVSFHGADVAGIMLSPPYRKSLLELFGRAELLPCRSISLAEKLKELGCPPEKICLQHTVLPDIPFCQHLPPLEGQWKILQIGRLIPKKGHRTSLQAFAIFLKEYPAASLTIIGEGPMKKELKELACQLNISHRVQFIDFQTQEVLQQFLASHSIFIHPSESTPTGDMEGIPNALLEALASGIPCIATEHGGIPEAMTNGVDGLLVKERHPEGLVQALTLLAKDEDFYYRVGQYGAANVQKKFGKRHSDLAIPYQTILQKY